MNAGSFDDHFTQLQIDNKAGQRFLDAVLTRKPVGGLTHNFYRYPARFSPLFARAAIETFSQTGDVVCDPFMGGATSLVEARACGRHSIGCDISSLAAFVGQVKTTMLREADLLKIAESSICTSLPRMLPSRRKPTINATFHGPSAKPSGSSSPVCRN